jgi:hypothetical protein
MPPVSGTIGTVEDHQESELMSTTTVVRPGPNAWRPVQLQLVLFPVGPTGSRQPEWWASVTGQEPEESRRKAHETTDTGTLADSSLSLTVDPTKITWTMTPLLDSDLPTSMIATLPSFPESRDRFIELMRPWLQDLCPTIKRIGFAGSLIQETASLADAYRLLGLYLPGVAIDPDSSDFLYRVNRKRRSNSAVPDLLINRITLWSALKAAAVVQTLNIGAATQPAPTAVGEPRYAAVLNLDVNSNAEREEELPQAAKLALLDELTAFAIEIASSGDVQ